MKLTFRPRKVHMVLEEEIKKLDPNQEQTRNGFTSRGIDRLLRVPNEDVDKYLKLARQEMLQANANIGDYNVPTSVQIYMNNDSKIEKAMQRVRRAYNLEIIQKQYFIQVIWGFYLAVLKEENEGNVNTYKAPFKVDKDESIDTVREASDVELIKKFVDVLYAKRPEDKKIIKIIRELLE